MSLLSLSHVHKYAPLLFQQHASVKQKILAISCSAYETPACFLIATCNWVYEQLDNTNSLVYLNLYQIVNERLDIPDKNTLAMDA
ncbi:MAG: hypothetical protein Q8L68_00070 [Methylococcales bacterium]|nr:hypothetical protein [Methylococcales bacterium]